jgi:short-subunit dehydrogenase
MTRRPAALVTGASDGIGRALAHLLAADGHDLVLVARREANLRELADLLGARHGVRSLVLPIDLAGPEAPATVAERVRAAGLEIDVLINNAGFGGLGPFAERPLESDLAMIQVNVACLTALTRLFLPGMLARRRGRILNVSSTAAFQPGPLMAVYYATKAYVQSFSEALAEEVKGSGVTVTALAPGPTRSGFQEAAGIGSTRLIAGRRLPDAMSVARVGYRAMLRGRRSVVPGLANRIGATAYRVLPRRVLTFLIRRLQESRQ